MKDKKPDACILDIIGNTPLIQLQKITNHISSKIFAKLEFLNPMGSVKDRIAKYMIEKAEKRKLIGKHRPGPGPGGHSKGISIKGHCQGPDQQGKNKPAQDIGSGYSPG
jgi:cystathionine beta-synthase